MNFYHRFSGRRNPDRFAYFSPLLRLLYRAHQKRSQNRHWPVAPLNCATMKATSPRANRRLRHHRWPSPQAQMARRSCNLCPLVLRGRMFVHVNSGMTAAPMQLSWSCMGVSFRMLQRNCYASLVGSYPGYYHPELVPCS